MKSRYMHFWNLHGCENAFKTHTHLLNVLLEKQEVSQDDVGKLNLDYSKINILFKISHKTFMIQKNRHIILLCTCYIKWIYVNSI